ncbi:MAG: tandem-95 repeat protein [Deltaproteobacteria bacterium]|nr:tandem-95 repeat protein [Deltaproteobacteria bacterium]
MLMTMKKWFLAMCAGALFLLTGQGTARAAVATFNSAGGFLINDNTSGLPYPSNITAAGMPGTVVGVTVTINDLSHTYPDDIDLLLVGPGGANILLMSDAGGAIDIVNAAVTFSDAGALALPDATAITAGTWRPANYGAGDGFIAPAPVPAGTQFPSLNTTFAGIVPNGTWSLYVMDDAGADTGTAGGWRITITTNTPPTINNIADQSTNEDTATGAIAVTVGDAETAVGSLVVTGTSSDTTLVPNGNIVFGGAGANRTVTLTPAANQFGTTTITITVTDASGATATDTFVLTVNSVNDFPVISPVPMANPPAINEDATTGWRGFNCTDVETASTSITLSTASSNTTIVPNLPANITFWTANPNATGDDWVRVTPATNQNGGPVTITVTCTDGNGASASTTFSVTVTAVNDAPTISNVADQSTNEDTATGAIAFTIGDVDNSTLFMPVTGTSSNTTLVPNGNIVLSGFGNNRSVNITPAANQFGTTTITLTVTDPSGLTATDTFVLTVVSVNDLPTMTALTNPPAINEDTAFSGWVAFTVTDVETAVTALTLSATSSNTTLIPNGNIFFWTANPNATGDDWVRVSPAANQNGTAVITVTVADANGGTASRTFTVTVNAVNDAPTMTAIANQTVNEDTSTGALAITVGDPDGSLNTIVLTGTSSNTTLIPNANITFVQPSAAGAASVSVLPGANQFGGPVTITVTATDSTGLTATRTFTVQINGVNDLPTMTVIADQTVDEDSGVSANNLFTIGDVETPVGSLVLSGTSSNTTLIPNANITFAGGGALRAVRVNPALNQFGTATITVTVTDLNGGTATRSYLVTVNSVNDLPTITAIANQIVNEDTPTSALAFTVGDVETPAANLNLAATSDNTTLVPVSNIVFGGSGANRTVTVTPALNQSGTALITVIVSDANGGTGSRSFTLQVNAVADAPTISNIPNTSMNQDTSLTLNFTVGDAEDGPNPLTVTATSSNTTLLPNANIVLGGAGANRTIQMTPVVGQTGNTTITVTVRDTTALTATDTFVLTVTIVNFPPSFVTTVPDQTINEDSATAVLNFTVNDLMDAENLLVLSGTSSNTTVVPNASIVFTGPTAAGACTVRVTPAGNQNGPVTITISVTDTLGAVGTDSFVVNITPVNDAPTISDTTNQTVAEDNALNTNITVGDAEDAAAALNLTATSSNTALVPNGSLILAGSGATRTLVAIPTANASGTTTITLTVTDSGSLTATDTFVLTVTAVNDLPTVSDVTDQVVDEDVATAALDITVGDVETPANQLVMSGTSSDTTLVPNANIVFGGSGSARTVTVTPAANLSGTATITITVTDTATGTATDTFVLTVNSVNDLPTVAGLGNQSVPEDTTMGPVTFTIGDVETPAGTLTVSAVSSNQVLVPDAAITLGGAGASRTLTVVPVADAFGTTTLTVSVVDANGGTTTVPVVLTVTSVNDLPTISAISAQVTDEDVPTAAVGFTVGDLESPATQLVVAGTSDNQALVQDTDIAITGTGNVRSVTVVPAANASGTATITLTVADTDGGTAVTTFVLTVNAVNDLPVISDVADATTDEDTATAAMAFTVNDVETASASLVVTASSSNTTLVPDSNIALGGSGASRTVTVTPAANQNGTATITLTVADANGGTGTDTFVLTVTSVNDSPSVSAVTDQAIDEDGATSALTFTVGDTETPVTNLVVTADSSDPLVVPTSGIALGGTDANRTVLVTPAANQNGTVTITLTVTDELGATATTTFQVVIAAVNDAPTLLAVSDQTTSEDVVLGPITLTLLDVDTAADTLVLTGVSSDQAVLPDSGIEFGGTGFDRTLTLHPAANMSGTSTVTLTVSDGALTAQVTFTLTVTAVNDAPTITDITDITIDEDTTSQALTFTIGDLETAADQLTVTAESGDTTLVLDADLTLAGTGADRTLTVKPRADAFGTVTITVSATDPDGARSSDTFVVTVTPINDAPVATTESYTATEDTLLTVSALLGVLANDLDPDLDALTAHVVSDVAHGTLTLAADGSFTYQPSQDYSGADSFTYAANDGTVDSNTVTVDLTVTAVNDAPVAVDATVTLAEDATQAITLAGTDVDGDVLVYAVVTAPTHGTLSGTEPNLTYQPSAEYAGPDSLVFSVTDPSGATDQATVTIDVTPVNDTPVLVAPTPTADLAVAVGSPITFTVAATDVDGPSISYSVTGRPTTSSFSSTTGVFTWTPVLTEARAWPLTLVADDGTSQATRDITLTVTATDTDADGVPDALEPTLGTDPNNPDSDGDTIRDGEEVGDLANPRNTDNAGPIDALDTDSDGDTITDAQEAGDTDLATAPVDTDNDGKPDYIDDDSDGDTVADSVEAGDADPATAPVDTDTDGTPDFLDDDSDGDGVLDSADNCRLVSNAGQEDANGNNIGDACDSTSSSSSGGTASGSSGGAASSSGGGGSSGGTASSGAAGSSGGVASSGVTDSSGAAGSSGGVASSGVTDSSGAAGSSGGVASSGAAGSSGGVASSGAAGSSGGVTPGSSSGVVTPSSGGGGGGGEEEPGGGGCGCEATETRAPAALLGLALLVLVARRRRAS